MAVTLRVFIAGITGIRHISLAREGFRNMIESGGELRVALLDPGCPAFMERREHESRGDREFLSDDGLTTLRMNAEFFVVMEVLKALSSFSKNVGRGSV